MATEKLKHPKQRETKIYINDQHQQSITPAIPVKKRKLHKGPGFLGRTGNVSSIDLRIPPLSGAFESLEVLKTKSGDPWRVHYRKVLQWHDLGIDGHRVHLAVQTATPEKYVNIREFRKKEAEDALFRVQQVRHDSFIKALEAFDTGEVLYVVFEEMNITLFHVVNCCRYPTPTELGAILGQIMDGLLYLESEDLEHKELSWKTVLLNFKGEVKIAYQDLCRKANPESGSEAVRQIGRIARGLINKDAEPIGILQPERLPKEAISFVAETTTARSVTELRKHQFLALYGRKGHTWHKRSLLELIALAATQAHPRRYRYKDESAEPNMDLSAN